MSFGLNDTFPFGRYKGLKVHELLLKDVGYACWLREARKSAGDFNVFNVEVNGVIDRAISESRSLGSKYKPWNLQQVNVADTIKRQVEQIETHEALEEKFGQERCAVYKEVWASW